MTPQPCEAPGCTRSVQIPSHGLCKPHCERKRLGKPLGPIGRRGESAASSSPNSETAAVDQGRAESAPEAPRNQVTKKKEQPMAKFSVGQIVKPIGKPHKRPLKALPRVPIQFVPVGNFYLGFLRNRDNYAIASVLIDVAHKTVSFNANHRLQDAEPGEASIVVRQIIRDLQRYAK